ncbi:Uncharacterised protein [Mycobacteroides abscessus]|nr:Uncharacterised protein [Mycobacteroides abscessus]
MTKQLHLDIPGAQGDVHKLDTDLKILDEAAGRQLQAYQQLAGSVKGVGMDTATDFSREQNSAITSVHSVVEHCRTRHRAPSTRRSVTTTASPAAR